MVLDVLILKHIMVFLKFLSSYLSMVGYRPEVEYNDTNTCSS